MALVLFGPVVSGCRGSILGTVFSNSRAGPFIRGRTTPVNTVSASKTQYQSIMGQTYDLWLNTLTVVQREDWNTLGAATDFTNSLGQQYHPSGWNLYLRSQSLNFRLAAFSPFTTPPANAVGTFHPITVGLAGPPYLLTLTGDLAWPDDVLMYSWTAAGRRQTINYFKGPYDSLVGQVTGDIEPPVLGGIRELAYALGDRAFFRIRGLYPDGSLTSAFHGFLDTF